WRVPALAAVLRRARALNERARSAYEAAFARHRQKLLFATPWPPSGLWTKRPVESTAVLSTLRVRTFGGISTQVFERLGAKATQLSFADLPPRLASGEIDAVLSSGDGGASRQLWDHLPCFTQLQYSI